MKKIKISDKIYSVLFVCWFLLSFIFAFVPTNKYVLFIDVGQFFLVFGSVCLVANKGNKKKFEDILFFLPIIIGILLIVVAILLYCKIEQEIIDNVWEGIFSFIFLFIGFILLVDFAIKRKKMKSDKYVLVYGKIIGLNTSMSDGSISYAPIISYTFNGKDYKYESQNYYNVRVLSVGDIIDIKVNLKNPEEIIFKEPGEWILLVLGIIFVSIFVLGIVVKIILN